MPETRTGILRQANRNCIEYFTTLSGVDLSSSVLVWPGPHDLGLYHIAIYYKEVFLHSLYGEFVEQW
jgi:hypothetical protein